MNIVKYKAEMKKIDLKLAAQKKKIDLDLNLAKLAPQQKIIYLELEKAKLELAAQQKLIDLEIRHIKKRKSKDRFKQSFSKTI